MNLSKPSPRASGNCITDCGSRNSKSVCEELRVAGPSSTTRNIMTPQVLDGFTVQFVIPVVLTILRIWKFSTAFLNHVVSVISDRPEPEMCWIDTISTVPKRAIVKNAAIFWNGSKVDQPRSSVSKNGPTVVTTGTNDPVTVMVLCRHPNPTVFCQLHLFEESVDECNRKVLWKDWVLNKLCQFHIHWLGCFHRAPSLSDLHRLQFLGQP